MGGFDAYSVDSSIIIDVAFFNECFLINVLLV